MRYIIGVLIKSPKQSRVIIGVTLMRQSLKLNKMHMNAWFYQALESSGVTTGRIDFKSWDAYWHTLQE